MSATFFATIFGIGVEAIHIINNNIAFVLIKYIDAAGSLSVQVHPGDDYAMSIENEYGKSEMWHVVDCVEGSFI